MAPLSCWIAPTWQCVHILPLLAAPLAAAAFPRWRPTRIGLSMWAKASTRCGSCPEVSRGQGLGPPALLLALALLLLLVPLLLLLLLLCFKWEIVAVGVQAYGQPPRRPVSCTLFVGHQQHQSLAAACVMLLLPHSFPTPLQ